ncbi:MAG: LysR substrate-binding domain-containing protein [Synoicihabitans sp.]
MELRHMRTFAAVAEHLSFTAAANEMRVAQPAVSQTIRDLEDEMGVQLFWRTKRSVRLTAAGTTFRHQVQRLLRDADAAVEETQRAARGEVGRISVGFMGPAMRPVLPGILADYESRYPAVKVMLEEMMPDQQEAAFRAGRLDVGFSRSLGEEADALLLEEELVYTDRIVAVLPASHDLASKRRVTFKQLAKQPLALFHRGGAPAMYDQIMEACRSAGVAPRVRHEPNQMMTVVTWVASGSAIGLVPGCVSQRAFPGVVFREITPSAGPLPLVMIHRRGDDSPTVAAWIERVRELRPGLQKQMEQRCGTGSSGDCG